MSGSAIADAGGLGILEIKAMKEDGYPVEFAGALTCASCIIGPLVPPSIPMVHLRRDRQRVGGRPCSWPAIVPGLPDGGAS